jgi:hypothetical protein
MLRLRLAIGVGIKADVLTAALGTKHPMTVREIADGLAYTDVGVRGALDDLARAGFVHPVGRKPLAYAAPHKEWQILLNLSRPPRWLPWHHWFAFVIDYVTWLRRAARKRLGDYALDVKIRELSTRHDLFFRYFAHELDALAFQKDMGSSKAILRTLIGWAREHLRSGPEES